MESPTVRPSLKRFSLSPAQRLGSNETINEEFKKPNLSEKPKISSKKSVPIVHQQAWDSSPLPKQEKSKTNLTPRPSHNKLLVNQLRGLSIEDPDPIKKQVQQESKLQSSRIKDLEKEVKLMRKEIQRLCELIEQRN